MVTTQVATRSSGSSPVRVDGSVSSIPSPSALALGFTPFAFACVFYCSYFLNDSNFLSQLRCGLVFIIHHRVHRKLTEDEPSTPVATVVGWWIKAIKSCAHLGASPILCFDRYYADNAAIVLCEEEKVSVVCSCMSNRFSDVIERLESGVQKRGDRVTLWDPSKQRVPLPFLFHFSSYIT